MLIGLLLLFLLSVTYGQVPPTDRNCGHDLANLWLDVVVVVDNSAPMTQEGLTEVCFLSEINYEIVIRWLPKL